MSRWVILGISQVKSSKESAFFQPFITQADSAAYNILLQKQIFLNELNKRFVEGIEGSIIWLRLKSSPLTMNKT